MTNFLVRILVQDEMRGARLALYSASLFWSLQLFISIDMFPLEGTLYADDFVTDTVAWVLGVTFMLHGVWGWISLARPLGAGYMLCLDIVGAMSWVFAAILYALLRTPSASYILGQQFDFLPLPFAGQFVFCLLAWWSVARSWTEYSNYILISTK